ncbi:M48 family metallopeptidase [uncultured Sulfitobacter sp.]|uniref:M48 family metallopeptidase n=1 Tax=uncultured Sulfitobacter sp. TaxID=191468 RepID=UPI00261A7BD4|nr:M48 family metallopeptidase [uncultured Sulfitobacter sp.]
MSGPPDLPPAADAGGVLFDGDKPVAQTVRLRVDRQADVLEISGYGDDMTPVHWPLAQIRRLPDIAGGPVAVVRWTEDPVARLQVPDARILAALPRATNRGAPKGRARLAGWALAAVAAVALQIGVLIPLLADRLSGFVPPEGERALGEATFGQIREALAGSGLPPLPICEGPAGIAALDTMRAALGRNGAQAPLSIFVLDHEMVNAFALPGGVVVFFRGMIDAAENPNEIAAVLAHEIGHVENRDPTRHALRSAGSIGILGLLFGDFAGGAAVLFLTERLISARYSQAAEAGADAYAYGALEQAGVSPAALGDMFERLRDRYGDTAGITAHFVSHPTLTSRITRARASARPEGSYGAIVTDEEWAALKTICD